jgi:hypothetical protein
MGLVVLCIPSALIGGFPFLVVLLLITGIRPPLAVFGLGPAMGLGLPVVGLCLPGLVRRIILLEMIARGA